jgi:hypothetical protein
MTNVDLHQLLLHKQTALAAKLQTAEALSHPVAKGDINELNWRAALDGRHGKGGFLPERYAVSSAFIVDADGNTSEQIDLVVHDAHFCPLFFEEGDDRYIPAESVYAVFEIKPELNRENVLYAGQKAASVRQLRRTSVPIVHAGGTFKPRKPFTVLAGILTTSSGWTPFPFGDSLAKALKDVEMSGQLDFGATAEHGAFEVLYESDEPALSLSEAQGGLMFFLTHLYTRLQSLGTVTAIDLAEYARPLEADSG